MSYNKNHKINLEIEIDIERCEKIKHSLYKLPIAINGCDVFKENWSCGSYGGGELGHMEGDVFTTKFYTHTQEWTGVNRIIVITSHDIDTEFHWT